MGTIENLELGPAIVEFGEPGALVDLGFTKGGVTMTITTDTADVTTDQFGTVIMKQILVGRNVLVRCPFAETSLDLISSFIPLTSGVVDSVSADKKHVVINTPVGADLVASASKELRLTKSIGSATSTDPNDVFKFFKAAATGAVEVNFSIEDQRVWEVEFQIYPDQTQNFALGIFGDETAVP